MSRAPIVAAFAVTFAAMFVAGEATHAAPPPPSGSLVLWLKADAIAQGNNSAVTTWNDSGPNGTNPTQATASSRPTFTQNVFGYYPGVTFDGDDYLRLTPRISTAGGTPPGLSYFAVMRTTVNDTTRSYAYNSPQTLIGENTGNIQNGFGINGAFANYVAVSTVNLSGTTVVNDGAPHIIGVTQDLNNAPGDIKLYVQGVLEATASTNPNGFYGFNLIGAGINLADFASPNPTAEDFFRGDVAEILVYNTVLSDANRQAVEAYLYEKYFAPEPASLALLAGGAALLLSRGRVPTERR